LLFGYVLEDVSFLVAVFRLKGLWKWKGGSTKGRKGGYIFFFFKSFHGKSYSHGCFLIYEIPNIPSLFLGFLWINFSK
jgi:hypothetical protein